MHSLDQAFISRLLAQTMPSFQLSSRRDENLGFGYLFYGLARTLRPKKVVVIGSKAGFSPICFGKGLLDNGGVRIATIECEEVELHRYGEPGTLDFIDPSYSMFRNDKGHSHGRGLWDDADRTRALWRSFGLEHIITHHCVTS